MLFNEDIRDYYRGLEFVILKCQSIHCSNSDVYLIESEYAHQAHHDFNVQ